MTASPQEVCRVCGTATRFMFRQPVLGHDVSYFDCGHCGYFQTERPYWLERAYASAINEVDTGILSRNQLNLRRVIMTLAATGRMSGRVVDHAGGYGILVRLLRDAGVDAYWRDKYCQNLMARGFEADGSVYDLLTAFEVFEHMESPLSELEQMLQAAPVALVSTDLVHSAAPPAPDWWYLGTEHGQHIGFFRLATLDWMAQRLGCHYSSDGRSLHIFARDRIPRRWHVMTRLLPAAPLLSRWRLRSRTWADFERLRAFPR